MLRLWEIAWSWPFVALLVCCHLNYRWNLHGECKAAQQKYWSEKQKESGERRGLSPRLRQCFFANLAAAAGRMNPWVVGGLLCLGGAGSLLWMLISAPICLFLRFVQANLLTPCEKGEGTGGIAGIASLAERELWQRMQLSSGKLLSRGLQLSGGVLTLSLLSSYGLLNWVEENSRGLSFGAAAAILCLVAVLGGCWTEKTKSLAGIVHLLLLGLLLLLNLSPMTVALEGILSDGFQMGSYAGSLFGLGGRRAVITGVAASCYAGGLTEETSVRNYLRCLEEGKHRDAQKNALIAGLLSAAEAAVGILVIGFGTGLFLLCREMSSLGGMRLLDRGIHRLLGVVFLLCSAALTGLHAGQELRLGNEAAVSRLPVVAKAPLAWLAVVGIRWLMPAGENGIRLLLLVMWPVLLFHLLAWIALSFRMQRLWAVPWE